MARRVRELVREIENVEDAFTVTFQVAAIFSSLV